MKITVKIISLILITLTFNLLSAQTTDPKIQSAKSEILGEWVSVNDSSSIITFYNNGVCKGYYDQELIYTHHYDIDWVCDRHLTAANNLLLITYDNDGTKLGCDIIQVLNNNNSGILSLTTENQGKNILYKRP